MVIRRVDEYSDIQYDVLEVSDLDLTQFFAGLHNIQHQRFERITSVRDQQDCRVKRKTWVVGHFEHRCSLQYMK